MQAQSTSIISVGGVTMTSTVTRTADAQIGVDPSLPAAKSGALTTRTGDSAGTMTLESGHGIQTGDVIEVYWEGGMRYRVTVGTVSGTSVPFSAGSGDALPAQGTSVTASKHTELDIDVEASRVKWFSVQCDKPACLHLYDDTDTLILSLPLPAGEDWTWRSGGTVANPFGDNAIAKALASQSSSSATATLKIGILYDSEV